MHTAGATPAASLSTTITVDIRRGGRKSAFSRIRPGVFGLRGLHEPSAQAATVPQTSGGDVHEVDRDEANLGVRVPFFPIYSELRHLLRIWPGPPPTAGNRSTGDVQRTAWHTTKGGRSDQPMHLDPGAPRRRRPRSRPGYLGKVERHRESWTYLRSLVARAEIRSLAPLTTKSALAIELCVRSTEMRSKTPFVQSP